MDSELGRYDYRKGELLEEDLQSDPIQALKDWLEVAQAASVIEPMAMCLSTVNSEGRPSSRMVLLRGIDELGLRFFSNYESRKGHDLAVNPYAALNFWWSTLERQVRAEGRVQRLSDSESDAYFTSRPYESQLASAASPQSQVVPEREYLDRLVDELGSSYPTDVPRPSHWGGYVLVPDRIEFWQGRPARLHDRIEFVLQDKVWRKQRLAP